MVQWLDPKAPTLARMLHEAGLCDGPFWENGTWAVNTGCRGTRPPHHGIRAFDESLTQFEGIRRSPAADPAMRSTGKTRRKQYALGSDKLGRGKITWVDRSRSTGSFAERALQFIQQAERTGKPFYLNLWPDDVHSPFFFPPKSPSRRWKQEGALPWGSFKATDDQLAPIIDYVRNSATLSTNTLIVCGERQWAGKPGAGFARVVPWA